MDKLIAAIAAAVFATFTMTAFAADEAKPADKAADKPAVEKKHHKKKHHEEHHGAAPKADAPAGEKK